MVIRTSKKDLTSFLLVLLLTVVSNDTFLFGSNSNEVLIALPRYGLLGLAIYLGIKLSVEKKIIFREFFIAFIMASMLIVSCIYNNVSISLLIIKVSTLFAGFLFCQYLDFEKWSVYFRKTMYLLAICSIIMTIFAYITPSLISTLPTATNISGVRMYLGVLSGILDFTMNTIFIRCPGVFWEPGVYQIYLNLAILLMLYSAQERKGKYIIVYLIALFFTFSTTGYIGAAWIFVSYFAFAKKTRRYEKIIMCSGLLFLAFLAAFILSDSQLFNFVLGKLNKTDSSFIARFAGFVINYQIAIDNPIFGFGADMHKMSEEFIKRSSESTIVLGWTKHNTNTLMYQFAAFGIPFGIFYLIGTFNFGRLITYSKMAILSIFGTLVILYTGENLFSSIFPYIIVFYGMKSIGHSTRKKKMVHDSIIKDCIRQ